MSEVRSCISVVKEFLINSPLVRGQKISLLIAGTGVFATLLSNYKPTANFPTFMNFINYLLLSFFMIKRYIWFSNGSIHTASEKIKLSNSLTFYLIIAILDVEANFLVLTAYNYTSITSIMLLDCFTIPCSMVLSSYFLKAKYQNRHIIGILICLGGLGCIIISDIHNHEGNSDAIIGDILCLSGAFFYATTNVLQERVVKTQNREEYLGMLGIFGSSIAMVQFLVVDLNNMCKLSWNFEVCLYILGFVSCLNLMYVNTSFFLQEGDSTMFNLSLLTSDVYAVIFSYFLTEKLVSFLYFIGFAFVIIGLFLYHSNPHKPVNINLNNNPNADEMEKDFDPSDLSHSEFSVNYNPIVSDDNL